VEFAYLDPMTFEEFILAATPVAHKKLTNLDLLEPTGNGLHGIFYSLYKQISTLTSFLLYEWFPIIPKTG
jgi:hypothetical protein